MGYRRALKLEVFDDAAAAVDHVARHVVDLVLRRSRVNLGLATGRTMRPIHARLCDAHRSGISFRHAATYNLDEYLGLPASHPASFRSFMEETLFGHVDIADHDQHVPDGMTENADAEARRYDAAIGAAGGIDLQLLGIGANGHIGFNEPGSDFSSRTRAAVLAPATRAANAASFTSPEEVPRGALTMGIGTILEAREIIVVALGGAKARAVAAALDGPISTACPASALRLHRRATIVCDAAAAVLLTERPDTHAVSLNST